MQSDPAKNSPGWFEPMPEGIYATSLRGVDRDSLWLYRKVESRMRFARGGTEYMGLPREFIQFTGVFQYGVSKR
jgi:hypothetical protein